MKHKNIHSCCCALGLLAATLTTPFVASAADHFDAPLIDNDQAADIGDVYAFLDPNDNSKVILAFDVHGFIVPGQNANAGAFDPDVLFQFSIENTGDATPDKLIMITFDPQTSRSLPQTAHITIASTIPPGHHGSSPTIVLSAPTTVASSTSPTSPTQVVTTDAATGISFFAGLTDDPFFFDVPGFNRFIASVLAHAPDPSQLNRGRDTFAGYNTQMMALSVPAALLKGSAGNVIGVSATTLRGGLTTRSATSDPVDSSGWVAVDRAGLPAINTVLIPFARKNEYNRATTVDDANGKFAADIVATLKSLGTDAAHINILAGLAVNNGDMLRLDTSKPNTGLGGGTNATAAFPNGRRLADDVIDTVLNLVTNGTITTGDHVNANDVPFRNVFPFFAPSQQPFAPGIVDDNTRN